MTDDEALKVLASAATFDQYADGRPDWTDDPAPSIRLDGSFTADELRALLHFAP
jgi:hypothetical protein